MQEQRNLALEALPTLVEDSHAVNQTGAMKIIERDSKKEKRRESEKLISKLIDWWKKRTHHNSFHLRLLASHGSIDERKKHKGATAYEN